MNIFPLMNDIIQSENEMLKDIVKKSRKTIWGIENENEIDQNARDFSFSQKNSSIPLGRLSVCVNGVRFECFYEEKNQNADELWIILSGSKTRDDKLPLFKRWSWYKYIDAYTLSIADPMLLLDEKTFLGWYYGTKEHCYMNDLVELVRNVAEIKGICHDKIVFYGSSGGGYAALYCACELKGSTAIVINPQIKLAIYKKNAEYFKKHLGIDLNAEDIFMRTDLGEKIVESDQSKFLLIENCQSEEDMLQLSYLCAKIGTKYKYGLSLLSSHILCWCYDADGLIPHNCQENKTIFFIIQYLYHVWQKNKSIKNIESLYLLFGELWHEKYIEKKQADLIKREIVNLPYEILTERKQLLFSDQIHFEKSSDIWHNKKIYDQFSANTTYQLILYGINSNCQEIITIIVKDLLTNSLLWKKECHCSKRSRFDYFFRTSESTDKIELRIYPTKLGENSRSEVDINKACLYKLIDDDTL